MLDLRERSDAVSELGAFTVARVAAMFPGAALRAIERHLPLVLKALNECGLGTPRIAAMTLATIRAETAGFVPMNEMVSRFNTSVRGRLFDLYDTRKALGNRGAPDGERFRGRGFVQLTGRANYARLSEELGLGDELVRNPERANEPEIAARILARFIADKRNAISRALDDGDLGKARRLVNGGSHGLDAFSETYEKAVALFAPHASTGSA